jgi:soluble epoxide hydrolase/lipid-phosphate phosphatase
MLRPVTSLLGHVTDHKLPAQLPRNLPWLLIYGDKDKTCNPKLVQSTNKFVPQINVVKLEGISHWVMVEAKGKISDLVVNFVKDNIKEGKSKL